MGVSTRFENGARERPAIDDPRPVVAHLVHHYAAPTETFVVNQIESIVRYRVVLGCHHRYPNSLYPLGDGVAAADALGAWRGRADRLAYRSLALPTPFAASALARSLVMHDPALAHVHYLSDACYFHGVLRRMNIPFVVSGYGYDVSWFPQRGFGLGRVLARRAFRAASGVLAMSDDMRHDLLALGCPPEKIITHYYGSDSSRFVWGERGAEARRGDIRLLSSCGRLAEKKGLEITLEALALLRDQGVTGWSLTVLGDGPRRAAIERVIAHLGIGERVHLAGHVPYTSASLPAHYRDADILVQPSIHTSAGDKEGIPGVIVEGMASGLAVVASRHAGIPAVVEDGVTGLLVPERDPAALCAALARLINDPALRACLGRAAARRAADDLDLRVRTPVLESIYDRIAGRERSDARLATSAPAPANAR